MTTLRFYMVTVERNCVACRKVGNHPLGACSKFQGMSREEGWDMVKKAALCKICSKPGHIASKCHAPPMCKKCNKHHHTLLHKAADPKTEGTQMVSKDVTYAAPSKPSKEVLLITCRVEVIAPDGSITQARALLDSAASTLLITECLVKKLCLPQCCSNFKIKSTDLLALTPTQRDP